MKFIKFLTSLQHQDNISLLESIKTGYLLLFESEFRTEKLEELIKADYGPYKDKYFEFHYIESKGWDDEVIANFVKVVDKPDMESLGEYAIKYAEQIGLKFDKIEDLGETVKVHFDRIELGGSRFESVDALYDISRETKRIKLTNGILADIDILYYAYPESEGNEKLNKFEFTEIRYADTDKKIPKDKLTGKYIPDEEFKKLKVKAGC